MTLNINSANFQKASRFQAGMPFNATKTVDSLLSKASPDAKKSESAFDLGGQQPVLASSEALSQQITSLLSLLKTILESLNQSADYSNEMDVANSQKSGPSRHSGCASASSGQDVNSPSKNEARTKSGSNPVSNGSNSVSNSKSNLPAINSDEWSTRDGKNGEEFATPFVSKNVIKNGGSITTQLKGNEGAEAILDKEIGTGFYQFNVNPKLSSQVGDIPTVFFYSGKGSNGGDVEGGFELDAEYNMVERGTVTFGTWIDGKKYNEVTVPAPKGDQTIGFNIQDGMTQIGFVNPDGSFEPVSETRDERITPELASNLQAMSNTWRSKSSGGSDNGEVSSITINGFGRSDAPGEPVEAV